MTEKKLKKLPLGLVNFEKISQGGSIYVDKTKFIHQLITGGEYYFLSRPRRFGKSLLISTLHAIFAGKRELFKDLWIYSSNYDWQEHPVIRIDFSTVSDMSARELELWIVETLQDQADDHDIDLSVRSTLTGKFEYLIKRLSHHNKVVVLIDEYDKPILDHITESRKALVQRKILKKLYSVLKGKDAYLRFVLLTGVSKFSKTSIFSGLNNLTDISMDARYAAMLGYTQQELKHYFADYLERFALKNSLSSYQALEKITRNYDGYLFFEDAERMFNPYSVMRCFDTNKLSNYWFATGTPTFVIDLLQNSEYPLKSIYEPVMSPTELDAFEPDKIKISALLYQSGYLTIKSYNNEAYTLGYPNYEVADGFNLLVTTSFSGLSEVDTKNYIKLIWQTFLHNNMQELEKILQKFFDSMTYDAHIRDEYDLKIVLFSVFRLIGIEVNPEVKTSRGIADLVIELPGFVYIIELKFNKTAQKALAQIKDQEYYAKYLDTDRHITLIGINFTSKNKKVRVLSHALK